MVLPLRDENPTTRRAFVTIALIAINIFVYFAVQPHATGESEQLYLYRHAAVPCELTTRDHIVAVPDAGFAPADTSATACVVPASGISSPVVVDPNKNIYLAVIWSMFLHGSIAHVLGNMLFLWIFGNNVEDRLRPIPYLLFYLAAGIVAAATFVLFNAHATDPVIGASGAIAGVMGAYLIWFPRTRILSLVGFFPVYLPAVVVLGLWFGLQFFTNPNEGVAWQAHIGGFLFGALVALATRPFFGPRSPRAQHPNDWDSGFRGGYPGRY